MLRLPMTAVVIGLAVAVLVILIASRARRSQREADLMRALRLRVLEDAPETIGLSDAGEEPFAVLMDIGFDQKTTATIFAAATGDASLYLSSGGGVIGGFAHENVRAAAAAFVAESAKHLQSVVPTTDYPYPAPGHVRFYIRTREAVYAGEAPEGELAERTSSLWPLFYAGQNVLTQLRLTGGSP